MMLANSAYAQSADATDTGTDTASTDAEHARHRRGDRHPGASRTRSTPRRTRARFPGGVVRDIGNCRPVHRRLDCATPGPDRAALRRTPANQHPRLRRQLLDHAAQRHRAGEPGQQPRRRVRPVSVRTDQPKWWCTRPPKPTWSTRACPARSTSTPFARWRSTSEWSRSARAPARTGKPASTATATVSAFSHIDQFKDRTIGLALGYALPRQSDPGPAGTFLGLRRQQRADRFGTLGAEGPQQSAAASPGTLEWKPTDNFPQRAGRVLFQVQQGRQPQRPAVQHGSTGTSFSADGTATAGTANIAQAVVRNDCDAQHDKLFSLNWNNKLRSTTTGR